MQVTDVGLVADAGLAAGAVLLTAGVLALYVGWKQRQRAATVADTPLTAAGGVDESGLVRVRGTVTPVRRGETFRSPVRDDPDCVLAAWEIEEKPETGKTKSWERSAWGVRSVPFALDDGTGLLYVDPGTHAVSNETDDVFTPESVLASNGVAVEGLVCEFDGVDVAVETDYGEAPPRRVKRFLETTDGVAVDPMGVGVERSKRRYGEQTLAVGDAVSVLGVARPRRDGVDASTADEFVVEPGEETTHLSTVRFDDLPDGGGNLWAGALLAAVGVALLGASLVLW
ncbi:hypothetical protein [Salinirarus marinus]|uniref:hypothetical protein n=1 Tax=Salinirarus marinus TaxID=3068310 RepID=UPI003C6CAA9A